MLGRQFGLPLLEGVADREPEEVRAALTELQRLDLVREGRRWPEPEFRFKHALIQEAAYRTLVREQRNRLHRKAAEWLEAAYAGREDEVAGLLAHHWLGAADEDKAVVYLTARATRLARSTRSTRRSVTTASSCRSSSGAASGRRSRWSCSSSRSRCTCRSASRRRTRPTSGRSTSGAAGRPPGPVDAALRVATSFLPNDPDPRSAIAWPNIQLCMQLFDRLVEAWPERTIVPSLAERWEIADDGLRYVFHLREGLRWSDGEPLTAHDVEFGIKRVLNPDAPGSSVAIYFVLENGQDYYLRRNDDADSHRRAGARRPHGRVPPGGARAVLHERDEPARRRAAAAPRDRARRRRVDRAGPAGRERAVPFAWSDRGPAAPSGGPTTPAAPGNAGASSVRAQLGLGTRSSRTGATSST